MGGRGEGYGSFLESHNFCQGRLLDWYCAVPENYLYYCKEALWKIFFFFFFLGGGGRGSKKAKSVKNSVKLNWSVPKNGGFKSKTLCYDIF